MGFYRERRFNPLLMGLIVLSLGVHSLIFLRIAGVYRSRDVSVIELTVRDTSKPFVRDIPRPRVRREIPSVNPLKALEVPEYKIPKTDIDPVKTPFPDSIAEKIPMPDISRMTAQDADLWKPFPTTPAQAATPDFSTRRDYFDMLRSKIEKNKKYPESARIRQIEGRSVVRFVIGPGGQVSSVEIVKSSGNDLLDKAAGEAVKKASPFPVPPENLFSSKGLPMEITIVFELM